MTEERGAFFSPTNQSRFFSFFFPTRCFRLLLLRRRRRRRRLRLILLLLPSSSQDRAKATKQRLTEGGSLALYGREKRFQSKKGRSAPHIPPVVSAGLGATEPLRGSTIRGPSGAQRARNRAIGGGGAVREESVSSRGNEERKSEKERQRRDEPSVERDTRKPADF